MTFRIDPNVQIERRSEACVGGATCTAVGDCDVHKCCRCGKVAHLTKYQCAECYDKNRVRYVP